MTLKERISNYKAFIDELTESRQKLALTIAKDTFALVANRIQNRGVDAEGKKMKAYSKMHAALRKAYGLPINMRTLTFTGDMFASIHQEVIENTETRTVVEIKSRDRENQDKINENSDIVDISILAFDKDEEEMITDANRERLAKIKAKYKI